VTNIPEDEDTHETRSNASGELFGADFRDFLAQIASAGKSEADIAFDKCIARIRNTSRELFQEKDWPRFDRSIPIVERLRSEILARYTAEGWSSAQLEAHVDELESYLRHFDEIIRPTYFPNFLQNGHLWLHLNIGDIFLNSSGQQRENFKDQLPELRQFISTYLGKPPLHYPYLDWLMLDAAAASSVIECMEMLMVQRHGAVTYAICGANPWKLLLIKSIYRPLSFAFNWAGPGLLAWWISGYSLLAGLIIGGLLYALNVTFLISWAVGKVKRALSGKPSFAAIVEEQISAYASLYGPVLHAPTIRAAFERAVQKGMVWGQEAMTILDRVAANPPRVWTNSAG